MHTVRFALFGVNNTESFSIRRLGPKKKRLLKTEHRHVVNRRSLRR